MSIKSICHLTTAHPRYDVRIFLKEASFLATDKTNNVNLIVADDINSEVKNRVTIESIGKPTSRLNRMVFASFRMLKKAYKINSDIYHIHDPELFWLIIPLRIAGKKVIIDLHEDLPSQILSKPYLSPFARKIGYYLASIYESILFPLANYIITATPYIRDINLKKNKNIICVSNYPVLSEFRPEKAIDKTILPKAVCYTGAITTIRGVGNLIDAVLESNGDWILHLAGPIGDAEIDKKLKESLQVTNRIKYWGKVERKTLVEIFNSSSAGFVPFFNVPNHINAVPNKLFEYMSSGIPVICSNFKYWQSVVKENQTGLLIDPTNITEIIQSIEYIFANPTKAKFFGENGIKAVEKVYNWEAESVNLKKAYDYFKP